MLHEKLAGIRILLVDDEFELLEIEEMHFELEGALVTTAEGGHEAFDLFKKNDFDIVVTDIRMPKGDGPYLIGAIREVNQQIPIVCVSGFSDFTQEELEKIGATKFVEKPFSMDELADNVAELVANLKAS